MSNDPSPRLPVFAIERHRLTTDGQGVSTLVGAYGCTLSCRFCINPHAWNPNTLKKCVSFTPETLYDRVRTDELYFLATGGGVTFGGGEALLHAEFIRAFRQVCGGRWRLTAETSLQVPPERLEMTLDSVDEYIVDIKDLDPEIYLSYTGMPIDRLLANLRILSDRIASPPQEGRPVNAHIRVPLIPGYNTPERLRRSVDRLRSMGFSHIETFPYILR